MGASKPSPPSVGVETPCTPSNNTDAGCDLSNEFLIKSTPKLVQERGNVRFTDNPMWGHLHEEVSYISQHLTANIVLSTSGIFYCSLTYLPRFHSSNRCVKFWMLKKRKRAVLHTQMLPLQTRAPICCLGTYPVQIEIINTPIPSVCFASGTSFWRE